MGKVINMMQHYSKMKIPEPDFGSSAKGLLPDNNIFTFDIETISLYNIQGKWQPFDYSIPSQSDLKNGIVGYDEIDKRACCYIWQFGINDKVYYGRELDEFANVLKALKSALVNRYIYVHNLGYEMQWLFDIIIDNGWHIDELVARNLRQPISFKIRELNIYFRCSYMLTNLSLEKAAEKYTDVKKAVGELDYNIPYSPLSELPEKVLHYCEMDIITLYKIILFFRNEYKNINKIPLTQTGCVRKSLRDEVGFYYIKEQQKKVPTMIVYLSLMQAFQGGLTHANILYVNTVVNDVWSYDFSSSYPYVLICREYPSTPFVPLYIPNIDKLKKTHCILYKIIFKHLRSKYYNHYIAYSKMFNVQGKKVVDNGRLVLFDGYAEMLLTDVDFEIIKDSYECEYIIDFAWGSRKKPLDSKVVKFILDRYNAKTTLKGVEGQEDFYMKMKQELNSIFGMSCTNPLKSGIYLDENMEWKAHSMNDPDYFKFVQEKLNDMRKSFSTLFFPMATGVWCCAYARENLFRTIMQLDRDIVYYDTDSIKGVGDKVIEVVKSYNNKIDREVGKYAAYHKLDQELFRPLKPNGEPAPIGYFDEETKDGLMKSFKTLGAKKYFYIDNKGNKHLTMSGVQKAAGEFLDMNTFKNGTTLGYHETKKNIHYYNDMQVPFEYKDVDGNIYRCMQKHSIVLQPTTYTIGQTEEFLKLILKYKEHYIEDLGGV